MSHAKQNDQNATKQLNLQISVLEKAAEENDKLVTILLKDKDRVGLFMKQKAPHLYRQLQDDIFTELQVYKQKVLN